MKIYQF